MTVYELKRAYYANNPEGHFFDRKTLKFWGETLHTMYVYAKPEQIRDHEGNLRTCYVLRSKQRINPAGPRIRFFYFDTETFDYVFPEE